MVRRYEVAKAGKALRDDVEHGPIVFESLVLRQPRDVQTRLPPDGAGVGRLFAADNLEQRGLAASVPADHRRPLTGFEPQARVVQQRQMPVGDRYAVE
jgi:hypothetical protein